MYFIQRNDDLSNAFFVILLSLQVRAQVISALEAFPKSKWAPDRSRGRLGTPSKTPLGEDTALLAPIAASLVASVFDSCFAVLQSVARLLQMLALAKPPAASAGLEMVLAAEGQAQIHGHSTTTSAGQSDSSRADSTGAGDALKECKFAWEVLQLECQALLAAVFGAPAPARRLRRVTAEVPTDGWLASVAMLEADDPDVAAHSAPLGALDAGSSMTFSLEEEFKTHLVPRAVTSTGAAAAPTSGHGGVDVPADYETFIAMIFGGQKGSAELAAAIYHPTIKLVEAAERLLGNVAETSKSPSSGGGSAARKTSLLQSSWRGSAGADASPRANAALLSSYLETFLRMEFLPAVYVSSRARSRALLEGGDALTPRLRLRGAYTPGAAVLPAASGAVRMAEELLGWATSVPPFAPNLAGVLENILGQVLEAFQAQANAAFGSALAGRLAEDVAAVQIMAKEPTAPLLGPPVAFNVAKEADAMDSFVSSAIAAGFGARERSLPRDLVARVLAYKPVQAGALLYTNGDATRLTALASLADSADYIADAIHASAAAAAFPAAAKTDGQSSPGSSGTPTRVGEVWLRHLGGLLRGPERREMDRGYAEGLAHAADRFRSLAGLCIRALRLELMLLAVFHLQSLPQLAAGGERATGAEDHVASLARAVAQLSEALGAYLPMERRLYVFASLPPAVMQIAVSMLPDFTTIDTATVTRVCRLLSALQPVLAASATDQDGIDPGDAAEAQQQSMDASRALEKAKLYYSLLTHSPEALLTAVAQKPRRFACDEYEALFKANMVGRRVTGEHVGRLQQVLTAAAVGR